MISSLLLAVILPYGLELEPGKPLYTNSVGQVCAVTIGSNNAALVSYNLTTGATNALPGNDWGRRNYVYMVNGKDLIIEQASAVPPISLGFNWYNGTNLTHVSNNKPFDVLWANGKVTVPYLYQPCSYQPCSWWVALIGGVNMNTLEWPSMSSCWCNIMGTAFMVGKELWFVTMPDSNHGFNLLRVEPATGFVIEYRTDWILSQGELQNPRSDGNFIAFGGLCGSETNSLGFKLPEPSWACATPEVVECLSASNQVHYRLPEVIERHNWIQVVVNRAGNPVVAYNPFNPTTRQFDTIKVVELVGTPGSVRTPKLLWQGPTYLRAWPSCCQRDTQIMGMLVDPAGNIVLAAKDDKTNSFVQTIGSITPLPPTNCIVITTNTVTVSITNSVTIILTNCLGCAYAVTNRSAVVGANGKVTGYTNYITKGICK